MDKTGRKYLLWIGHGFFLVYLLFCLVFWRERMLHFDTAHYSYSLLLSGEFYVAMDRWIAIIPQIFPLAFFYLEAPLWLILASYSLGIGLVYYAAYLLVVYRFQQAKMGLWLCLALCLTLRYKFYGPVGEIIMSLALVAPFLAYLRLSLTTKARLWPLILLGLLLCTLGHPFMIPLGLLGCGFILIEQFAWKKSEAWYAIGILILGGLGKYLNLQGRSYETNRLDRLNQWWELWTGGGEFYALDRFWWFMDTEYHLAAILFLLAVGLMIYDKKYLLAAYSVLTSLAVAMIVISLHSYLNGPIYIMYDGYLAHIGTIWAFAIAFGNWRPLKNWGLGLISGILIFSLVRVADKHQFFEDREAYFNQVFADHPQTPKLLVDVAEFDWDQLWLEWATGAETLLITASRSEIPTSTLHFLLAGEDLTESELGDSSLILNHYLDLDRDPVKELPRDYFPIEEIPYKKISLKKQ